MFVFCICTRFNAWDFLVQSIPTVVVLLLKTFGASTDLKRLEPKDDLNENRPFRLDLSGNGLCSVWQEISEAKLTTYTFKRSSLNNVIFINVVLFQKKNLCNHRRRWTLSLLHCHGYEITRINYAHNTRLCLYFNAVLSRGFFFLLYWSYA